MRKKLPGKVEVIPEVIGHFEIIGCVDAMQASKSYSPRTLTTLNPGNKKIRRKASPVKVENIACVDMRGPVCSPGMRLNFPSDIGDKLKLGRTYKIQCTIVEVKEDAES
mgnify:CR=1 FL=1